MPRPLIAPAPDFSVHTTAPEIQRGVVNTSKKWELPPRPKPGRKAKAKPTKCQGHGAAKGSEAAKGHGGADDDHCGICTVETGCLCAEVGLRPAPPKDHINPANTLPTPGSDKEVDFTTYEVKKAVPLNRVAKSRTSTPKFARLLDVQPPTMDLPDTKCGFCTDQTPCVCTGEGLKEQSPETPKAQQACDECAKESFSMLFCLSLASCPALPAGVPSIPCSAAFQTLRRHPKYDRCDLGQLVTYLQASNHAVGVQSVNEALRYLNSL